MNEKKIRHIKHFKYDKQQRKLYEENYYAACSMAVEKALNQQKEEYYKLFRAWFVDGEEDIESAIERILF